MRRTIPLATLVVVTLALTACGGDPEPAASSASPARGILVASSVRTVGLGRRRRGRPVRGPGRLAGRGLPARRRRAARHRLPGADRDPARGGRGDALTLENLGCSGETTTSLVKGGKCDFAAGSQLEQAEKLLEASDDVSLVTIDIGGNDLLRCVRGGAQIDTACVTAGVGTVKKNLPTILKRLKAAAGDDVPVLVLGYYNPWLAAKALNQPIKGVDAAAKAYTALSTAIESAAKTSGTTFVGLDQAFSTNDTTPTTINGRSVPKNAAAICTLTNICTAADIHLTDEGAATVARVLAKAAQKAGVS